MHALIVSDIHGNLEALQAVLAAARSGSESWDVLWNLGDLVGYGASPNEVIDTLRPISGPTVRGNHDRVCCGLSSMVHFNPTARAAARWTLEELSPENLLWLRSVPQGPLAPDAQGMPGERVTLAHGSPLDEDRYIFNMRDAWAPMQQMTSAVTFMGHTHIQGGFAQNENAWQEIRPRYFGSANAERWTLPLDPSARHMINPGSVGQPRDSDWRAAFAVLDTVGCEITFHRVPYDVESAQARLRMAGLPDQLAARLRQGR
jgi:diadenosine tetraphosphatase ApaH/serine/threonine PP2A family protein phosphatase